MVDGAYNPSAWEVEETMAVMVRWPLGVLCLSVEETVEGVLYLCLYYLFLAIPAVTTHPDTFVLSEEELSGLCGLWALRLIQYWVSWSWSAFIMSLPGSSQWVELWSRSR